MIGFHVGRLLCGLGMHRWEWCDHREDGLVRSYFRCRRMCYRYRTWSLGNLDRIRTPWGPS